MLNYIFFFQLFLFISLHISPNEYKKDKYDTWINALYLLAYI